MRKSPWETLGRKGTGGPELVGLHGDTRLQWQWETPGCKRTRELKASGRDQRKGPWKTLGRKGTGGPEVARSLGAISLQGPWGTTESPHRQEASSPGAAAWKGSLGRRAPVSGQNYLALDPQHCALLCAIQEAPLGLEPFRVQGLELAALCSLMPL